MRKLIGRGAFSKAYQIDTNLVEVISICPTKEAYAMMCQGNPLAPVVECVDYQTFHMPLYPKMKSTVNQLNSKALHLYNELRRLSCNGHNYYELLGDFESLNIDRSDVENITQILDSVCNWISPDDVRFEISRRNVSCTESGDLVMLDCFFDVTLL